MIYNFLTFTIRSLESSNIVVVEDFTIRSLESSNIIVVEDFTIRSLETSNIASSKVERIFIPVYIITPSGLVV